MEAKKNNRMRIGRLFLLLEAVLLCFLGGFYFACGDGLYVRRSAGTVEPFSGNLDTGELTAGRTVEQLYTSQMDRIEKLGVMVSDYGRTSGSVLRIRLEDVTAACVIAQSEFPVNELGSGQYLYVEPAGGYEIGRGHKVKITVSCDGEPKSAPTVYYNSVNMLEHPGVAVGAQLKIQGEDVPGTLCFTVQGLDYVWTGPNYWKLVLFFAAAAALMFWTAAVRYLSGRREYLFSTASAMQKYRFLIGQLVSRDFKVRYKRSVLGIFWSFLNPLLMMIVQYLVFSQLFRSDIDNYPVYLLSGLVVFNFFTEGVNQALTSVVGNAALISKVYMPKYVYPVTRVLSSGINLLMSLIPLMLAAALTREPFTKAYLMLPYFLLCLVGFTIGVGMLLGALMVFFRDIQFLWGILSMLWMYLTPLFYPLQIIPAGMRHLFAYNPMLYFVNAVRTIVMEGITPQPAVFFRCAVITLGALLLGGLVFRKAQDKFIFYL